MSNEDEKYPYRVGRIVKATTTITEGGAAHGDPLAAFPDAGYIHAQSGDRGSVVHIEHCEPDGNIATVRFTRTGTATIALDEEIVLVALSDID